MEHNPTIIFQQGAWHATRVTQFCSSCAFSDLFKKLLRK